MRQYLETGKIQSDNRKPKFVMFKGFSHATLFFFGIPSLLSWFEYSYLGYDTLRQQNMEYFFLSDKEIFSIVYPESLRVWAWFAMVFGTLSAFSVFYLDKGARAYLQTHRSMLPTFFSPNNATRKPINRYNTDAIKLEPNKYAYLFGYVIEGIIQLIISFALHPILIRYWQP